MSLVQKNIAYLLSERGLNPYSAAKLLNGAASQPTIHRIVTGQREPSVRVVAAFSELFGVTVEDLISRDLTQGLRTRSSLASMVRQPESVFDVREEPRNTSHDNVREGPAIRGMVPLLTSVQAGEWCEIAGTFQREDARTWLPCPVHHGPRTFCLVVEGESMRNPGVKPSYDPGDVIFVDPDVAANPGDRVVVRLELQAAATFKQYLEEDGRKLLKALNPDWTPRYIEINGNAVICGVVIGKWVPE